MVKYFLSWLVYSGKSSPQLCLVVYAAASTSAGFSPSLAPSTQSGFFFCSSSSMENSFFFPVFSWFLKLNSAAFFCSLANLFSYLDTFFRVGLMNFPLKSLTAIFSSLISKSLFLTSNSISYFWDSQRYIRSKYSLQICFSVSSEADSTSLGWPQRSSMTILLSCAFLSCSFFNSSAAFLRNNSLSFFFLSGVMNPFFAFLPAAWASSLALTSAFLRSISACLSSSPMVKAVSWSYSFLVLSEPLLD